MKTRGILSGALVAGAMLWLRPGQPASPSSVSPRRESRQAFVPPQTVPSPNAPALRSEAIAEVRRPEAKLVDEKDPEVEANELVRALTDSGRLGEYCAALPEGDEKQRVLRLAALATVPADPRAALALAQRMNAGAARTDVLQTAVYDWMTRDPLAATRWIETAAEAGEREALHSAAARAIAIVDPALAADWIATALKSEGVQHDTALCVVESWAARETAGAAAWVARFPASPARDAAIDLIAREWRRTDAPALQAWLEGLVDYGRVLARWEAARQAERATAEID